MTIESSVENRLYDQLLEQTSRSFALGIQSLREPERDHIRSGYLFCRVLDIFEDATSAPYDIRYEALESLTHFLRTLNDESQNQTSLNHYIRIQKMASPQLKTYLSNHKNEQDLFDHSAHLIKHIQGFSKNVREIYKDALTDMATGMMSEMKAVNNQGPMRLRSFDNLSQYCYSVAGTVGIFLTKIFCLAGAIDSTQNTKELEKLGDHFGRCLQLVNITKDFHADWQEGRCFWPNLNLGSSIGASAPKPSLEALSQTLLALGQMFEEHLIQAENYIQKLNSTRSDILFFCQFPLEMAKINMKKALEDQGWLANQTAPKVSRAETLLLIARLKSGF